MNNTELTELAFLADALAAVPAEALSIIEFTLTLVPSNSKAAEAARAIRRALQAVQQQTEVGPEQLRAAATGLARSAEPVAKTAGETLLWAQANRMRSDLRKRR